MDKAQKQLVDTYFRKREIATGDYSYGMYGDNGGIKPYELLYLIKTKKVNLQKMESSNVGHNIAELIKYKPELYYDEDIKPYLHKITINSKSNILQNRPEFIDIFDPKDIDALGGDSIGFILARQPQLIDRLDISKMRTSDIIKLVAKQPQFIDKFESVIRGLREWDKSHFLYDLHGYNYRDEKDQKIQREKYLDAIAKYPQYREIFKDELKKLYGYDITELLKRDFSLLDYFDLNLTQESALAELLKHFPELIDRISADNLNGIDGWSLNTLLKYRPELKPYFAHKLD